MKPVRPYLIAVGVLAVAFACDRSPTGVSQSPAPTAMLTAAHGPGKQGIAFMPCDSLPPEAVTRVIGRAGGSIKVGPHTLRVPQGALAHAVAITAEVPDENTGYNELRFSPHGLQFHTPASLTMSYANCEVSDSSRLSYLQIVYKHVGKIVEYEPSVHNLAAQTVTGEISHFSNFAIAW
jgi:hypothetical protein